MKKKRVIQLGWIGLALCLTPVQALAQTSPESARTAAEWVSLRDNRLDWAEIPALVHEYNATVRNSWQKYRQDQARGLSSGEYAQRMRDEAQAAYDEAVSNASSDLAVAMAESNLQQQLSQIDNFSSTTDGEIVRLGYERSEAEVVQQVRQLRLSYASGEINIKLKELDAQETAAALGSVQRRLAVGQATQLELLQAQEADEKAQAEVLSAQAGNEALRQKLQISVGWKYTDSVSLGELPEVSQEQLGALNPEAERGQAESASYSLRILNRRLGNAGSGSVQNQLNAQLSQARAQLKADMNERWQSLADAQTALGQAQTAQTLAAQSQATAEKQFALGSISARDLEKSRIGAARSQYQLQLQRIQLLQAYQNYLAGRDGLASTGSAS